jgi:aspartate/methionine/tyrosine aminotransferase
MNPRLDTLQPYPFEKLRLLLAQAGTPPADLRAINLSIGEPKHAAPQCVKDAIVGALDGLSVYPPTKGDPKLREAITTIACSAISGDHSCFSAAGARTALQCGQAMRCRPKCWRAGRAP